jgi:hypothetical protein
MRQRLPFFRSAAFALAPLLALAIACGGKVESLGKTDMQLMASTDVSGSVIPCPTGAAHRNACCQGGPNTAAACGVYPQAPFHACDPDWMTYPDPATCCDLNDPSHCAAPPSVSPPTPTGHCVYACPPGYYPAGPISPRTGSCCSTPTSPPQNPRGCFGWAPGSAYDTGQTFCDFVCPEGWQPLTPGSPDVCCRSLDGGVECFSQATGPAGTPTLPSSGAPKACMGSGGGSSGVSQCACSSTVGAHSYALTCSGSNTTQTCTCTMDGATTATVTSTYCSPSSLDLLWTNNCHFP